MSVASKIGHQFTFACFLVALLVKNRTAHWYDWTLRRGQWPAFTPKTRISIHPLVIRYFFNVPNNSYFKRNCLEDFVDRAIFPIESDVGNLSKASIQKVLPTDMFYLPKVRVAVRELVNDVTLLDLHPDLTQSVLTSDETKILINKLLDQTNWRNYLSSNAIRMSCNKLDIDAFKEIFLKVKNKKGYTVSYRSFFVNLMMKKVETSGLDADTINIINWLRKKEKSKQIWYDIAQIIFRHYHLDVYWKTDKPEAFTPTDETVVRDMLKSLKGFPTIAWNTNYSYAINNADTIKINKV